MSVCPAIGGVEQVPGARNSVCVATASGVHDNVTGVAKLALVTFGVAACALAGARTAASATRATKSERRAMPGIPPILAATCGVLPENSPP
jgi:hypothetical protein